ncbi:MAG TPA: hypothetical protein VGR26_18475 [Acidimicrobiales bacterium]|nr:hypothetical protein [Acidimicrobiales bacterium]
MARTGSTNQKRQRNAGRGPAWRGRWVSRNRVWGRAAVVLVAGAALVLATACGDGEAASGAFVGGDLHSLVVDPTNPERLFAGGHQAVSVSHDGGATWRRVPSLDDKDAMGWGFTEDAIYVSGHPGLSRSTDGGETFTLVNEGLPDTDVHAFGAGEAVLYGASPAVGVFASDDGGTTWEVRTNEAGHAFFGRILVDPQNDQHVLAADVQSGVVKSRDGGRTWDQRGGLPSAMWISAAPGGLETLVASGGGEAMRSTDGGRSWEALSLPEGAILVEVGADPDTMYAAGLEGTAARVWVSRDGGTTWSEPT